MGTEVELAYVQRWLVTALAIVAVRRKDDDVTQRLVAVLVASLAQADTPEDVYAATFNAAMYASAYIGGVA